MAKTSIKFSRIVGARWFLPLPRTVAFWHPGSAVHSQNSFLDVFFLKTRFYRFSNSVAARWDLTPPGTVAFWHRGWPVSPCTFFCNVLVLKTYFCKFSNSVGARWDLSSLGPRLGGPNYGRCRPAPFFLMLIAKTRLL